MSKQFQKTGIISFLILVVLLGLLGNGDEVYWRIFQFKIRNHSFMREGKCITINKLYNSSREVNIKGVDTHFIEADYPHLFRPESSYQELEVTKLDSEESLYQVQEATTAPGGYLNVQLLEYHLSSNPRYHLRTGSILHTVVYKKNLWGQYSKVDACRKLLG